MLAPMRRLVASTSLGVSLALAACPSFALPGTFAIDQVFSSADGTVQFIEVFDNGRNDCDANEQLWMGLTLKSTGPSGARTYVFPANLPNCRTSQRHILIATEGFAALGLVTPDFTIPNGFLPLAEGSVELAYVSQVSYTALPTDGVTALDGTGKPMANVATNLAARRRRWPSRPLRRSSSTTTPRSTITSSRGSRRRSRSSTKA